MKIDAGNFGECLARIAEKGKVTAGEALAILQEVSDRAEQMRATGKPDPLVAAAGDLANTIKEAAKQDRLDAVRNTTARNNIMDQIARNGGLANAEQTLRGILHGTNKGERDSIESQWKGNAAGWQASLDWQLRKGGVAKAAVSGEIDRDIATEMWAMNEGKAGQATKNNPARAIAEAFVPMLDHIKDRLNAAGARIGDATDYVAHTLHDPAKMRAAAGPGKTPDEAFAAWWKETEPKLADKTFETVTQRNGESVEAARQRFGRSVFDALITGVHMTPDGAFGLKDEGMQPPAFEGTHNIAKQVSQPRTMFWKDGASWNDYQKSYGSAHSIAEGVMMTVDKSARQLALMERMGTNPSANLQQIMRRVQENYRSDIDGIKTFQNKIPGLESVMAHLDGSANIPSNQMWARINSNVRSLESMSMLGGVGITHFASIWPTVTSEMVHHGVPRLQTLGNMAVALLRGKGSEDRRAVGAELGAYAHGLTSDMRSNWQADDNIPGRISTLANIFMKYTGIHYVFDNTQAGVKFSLANQLARETGKGFGELDPHLSQILGKYGVGEKDWDLLRGVQGLATADGRSYMTPKDAGRVSRFDAETLLRQRGLIAQGASSDVTNAAIDRYTQGLTDKLYAYYNDAAMHGVVTSGVKERAAVLGGERPGSFGGELRRYLLQFKMWPLAAMNQVIGREIHMSLSKGEAAWNLGTMAALSMAAGYVRMSVNDAATGRPIRNPLDPHTAFAALGEGGGLGVMGDFLFGETNRMGGGLVGAGAGPVVGDANSLVNIFEGWKQGKMGWPDLARFGVEHIPFANLAYVKGALDYMLWYHLYEAASPGWWERTNRRLQKEQGRTMQGYSPGQPIPYTPWGGSS